MSTAPRVPAAGTDVPDLARATGAVGPHTRIGRQGIYDRDGVVVGFEMLFRGVDPTRSLVPLVPSPAAERHPTGSSAHDAAAAAVAAGDHATSQVISATFGDFGLDVLGAGRPLYLNLTRAFLVGDLPLPFGPEGVVLEVLEHVVVDEELLAAVAGLRERGYTVAVDDFVGEEERWPLVALADVVKVDVLACIGTQTATDRLDDVVATCRRLAPHAVLLAERVQDADLLRRCLDLGFELFQGFALRRPDLVEAATLSPSQLVCLRLLRTIDDPDAGIGAVEDVVASDPGLSLRILRQANSASTASRRQISSLRQAVVLLGVHVLRTWVLLMLLGGASGGRRDDLVTILARARCCEAVARTLGLDAGRAFTGGLLSGVAEVLHSDVARLAEGAGVDADMAAALVDGAGPLGGVIAAVQGHEHDEHDAAARCGTTPFELSRAYLTAWSDALATVGEGLDR